MEHDRKIELSVERGPGCNLAFYRYVTEMTRPRDQDQPLVDSLRCSHAGPYSRTKVSRTWRKRWKM